MLSMLTPKCNSIRSPYTFTLLKWVSPLFADLDNGSVTAVCPNPAVPAAVLMEIMQWSYW